MRDWQAGRLRYLVVSRTAAAGMRHHDKPLSEGDELRDGARQYIVKRVDQPPNPTALGHAWAIVDE